jgi:hypothetical protein
MKFINQLRIYCQYEFNSSILIRFILWRYWIDYLSNIDFHDYNKYG